MPLLQVLRPTLPILIGASIMLTLSMGLRQSLGIFMQPLTHDIHISISDFTLALAVQNLAWGFLQPLAGAMTVRYGFRPDHDRGRADVHRGPHSDGDRERARRHHDRRRRADRHVARLHRGRDRDVGGRARGAGDGALDRARHRLRRGLARRAAVGAARADAQRRIWLARRARRLRRDVGADDPRRLVRRPRRRDSAAEADGRRHRRCHRRDRRRRRRSAMRPSW